MIMSAYKLLDFCFVCACAAKDMRSRRQKESGGRRREEVTYPSPAGSVGIWTSAVVARQAGWDRQQCRTILIKYFM